MKNKKRLEKLEIKKASKDNEVVIFIDGTCTYKGKQYTEEELYKIRPKLKNVVQIELE